MHEFTLWAPKVEKVSVKVGDLVYPMSGPDDRGSWQATVNEADNGSDYAFLLDHDPTPYPDPRSPWQPGGVQGPSRLYDQNAFSWTDAEWHAPPLASGIIYELHVGTF